MNAPASRVVGRRRSVRRLGLAFLVFLGCSSKEAPTSGGIEKTSEERRAAGEALQVKPVPKERLVLSQVLASKEISGGLAVPMGEFAESLSQHLVASGAVVARKDEVPEGVAARDVEVFFQLSYDWAPDATLAAGSLVVAAEARMEFVVGRGQLAPAASLALETEVPRSGQEGNYEEAAGAALRAQGEDAVRALADSLSRRERLRRAPHAELLAALRAGFAEPSMLAWALSLAADRGLREAAGAAAMAMRSSDESVRTAALAALVEFRVPDTVSAITDALDFNDYEELRVAIEALHIIGGEDAQAFLEFVASGHSDEEMRGRAKDALTRLRRNAGASQPRDPDSP